MKKQKIRKHLISFGQKLTIAAIFFLASNKCYSDWNPSYLMLVSLLKDDNQLLLEDKKFKVLKDRVLEYLKSSWCSKEKAMLLMDIVLLEQPKICVEVGVFSGSSLLPIAATLKHLNKGKLYAIDAWSNEEAIRGLTIDEENRQWWSKVDMEGSYSTFVLLLQYWMIAPYCIVIPKPSEVAVEQIHEKIDFLHFDGNLSRAGALKDAELYLPKVNVGGCILFSNLFYTIENIQPKKEAFQKILDCCQIICTIDQSNCVLLRKVKECN